MDYLSLSAVVPQRFLQFIPGTKPIINDHPAQRNGFCEALDFAKFCTVTSVYCSTAKFCGAHRCCMAPAWTGDFITHVIDCSSMKLVTLERGMSYVALSYVWGSKSVAQDTVRAAENRSLPNNIPLTIADAIKVTRALNQQYLWVHRYCILHSQSKPTQIANMNKIYQGA